VEKEERAFVFFFSHFQNIKKEGLVVAVFFFLKRPKESQHQQITLHLTHHQSIDQSINPSITNNSFIKKNQRRERNTSG